MAGPPGTTSAGLWLSLDYPRTLPAWGHKFNPEMGPTLAVVSGEPMSGRTSEISQEHHQDEGIKRRFDESVVHVEGLRLVVLGVDEQHPEAY